MKKILIATHGTFASGAESTVKFLMGDVGNITCINAYVDQDENLAVAIYYNLYRIAEDNPEMVSYLDADGYLERAYRTAMEIGRAHV